MIQTMDTETNTQANTLHQEIPSVDVSEQINAPDKLVPVGEAIRYRKRAQTAEQQLECLNEDLRNLSADLDQANQTITGLERRQQMDAMLSDANAIDLEAARLLTEQAVLMMDEPDIKMAIDDLRRHKPYLFRRRYDEGQSAMAPAIHPNGHDPAEQAAEQAAKSGDRRDLLRYLRLRRAR
jgi:predicted RNase H-like nuclease (RuvC/YqgF family)